MKAAKAEERQEKARAKEALLGLSILKGLQPKTVCLSYQL